MKKLRLYKELVVMQRFSIIDSSIIENSSNGDQQQLKIDIQKYHYFKNLDIKAYLIE